MNEQQMREFYKQWGENLGLMLAGLGGTIGGASLLSKAFKPTKINLAKPINKQAMKGISAIVKSRAAKRSLSSAMKLMKFSAYFDPLMFLASEQRTKQKLLAPTLYTGFEFEELTKPFTQAFGAVGSALGELQNKIADKLFGSRTDALTKLETPLHLYDVKERYVKFFLNPKKNPFLALEHQISSKLHRISKQLGRNVPSPGSGSGRLPKVDLDELFGSKDVDKVIKNLNKDIEIAINEAIKEAETNKSLAKQYAPLLHFLSRSRRYLPYILALLAGGAAGGIGMHLYKKKKEQEDVEKLLTFLQNYEG